MEELRNKLLDWAKQFETPDFIKDDPIFFPHKYSDKKDIEISAFLTSWIAFGNRKLIMQQAEILDNLMGNSPYAFIMNKVWEQYKENTNTFYRMFTYHDFFCICQRLYNIYQEWDDLEVFYEGYNNVIREIQTDFGGVKGIPKLERDSPCKRICLFLRWVVRKSPVDLGIWTIIHPTELYIPLDAHVAKMAHRLGITTRKTEDWKMVQQVTNYMKTIFPDDPCRGDFAFPGKKYFEELFRVSKNQIIFGGNYFTTYLPPKMGWIVWDKGQHGLTMSDGELAWSSFDKALRIITLNRCTIGERGGNIHRCQKPVKLYAEILRKNAKEGDKIFDSHLGSGSSRIAAYGLGFDFYATEIDEEYFEAQEERFHRECFGEIKTERGTLVQTNLFDK